MNSGSATGCMMPSVIPPTLGVAGYAVPSIVITLGYALFQTANNTAVMANVRTDQRGVVSGMLNLSRNLGLITGAALIGAVFALVSGTPDMAAAGPEAVARGFRITFAVGAALIAAAIVVAIGNRPVSRR